jgi:hypothetical protein
LRRAAASTLIRPPRVGRLGRVPFRYTSIVELDRSQIFRIHGFENRGRLSATTGLSFRRIATLIGVSDSQVLRDSGSGNAGHLADSQIVTEAHTVIHLAIANGPRG